MLSWNLRIKEKKTTINFNKSVQCYIKIVLFRIEPFQQEMVLSLGEAGLLVTVIIIIPSATIFDKSPM